MKTLDEVNDARVKLADYAENPALRRDNAVVLLGMLDALAWVAGDASAIEKLLSQEIVPTA